MTESNEDKRKHKRYPVKVNINFRFAYDIETEVKFQEISEDKDKVETILFSGSTQNVSSDGLCIISNKELKKGEILYLEVYVPASESAVCMTGEVRWSKEMSSEDSSEKKFNIGVLLSTVEGRLVKDTMYYDEEYHVVWSSVLESVLGTFRKIMQGES